MTGGAAKACDCKKRSSKKEKEKKRKKENSKRLIIGSNAQWRLIPPSWSGSVGDPWVVGLDQGEWRLGDWKCNR
jgi:hypothetical protein